MSDLTMPAMSTVLVGDRPERRVGTRVSTGSWRVFSDNTCWWYPAENVHDVVEVIPDGTPVDRIVVLPEVAEVTVDTEGYWHVGDEAIGLEDRGVYPFDVRLHYALVTAAKMTKILAARAAEPTPDPLDELAAASLALDAATDRYRDAIRDALAATEADR
jgi:hypothetical protein